VAGFAEFFRKMLCEKFRRYWRLFGKWNSESKMRGNTLVLVMIPMQE
jgi:hypothetical protein